MKVFIDCHEICIINLNLIWKMRFHVHFIKQLQNTVAIRLNNRRAGSTNNLV